MVCFYINWSEFYSIWSTFVTTGLIAWELFKLTSGKVTLSGSHQIPGCYHEIKISLEWRNGKIR